MTVDVVDSLEVIEIDSKNRQVHVVTSGMRNFTVQQPIEQHLVWQPRQAIVVLQVNGFFFGTAKLRDINHGTNHTAESLAVTPYNACLMEENITVFAVRPGESRFDDDVPAFTDQLAILLGVNTQVSLQFGARIIGLRGKPTKVRESAIPARESSLLVFEKDRCRYGIKGSLRHPKLIFEFRIHLLSKRL